MKTVAVIQARMGSTRLPGKVLKPILGQPMLARMLERVKRAKTLDAVVVATSDKLADDAVVAVARAAGERVFRGSEEDVLDRVYRAAKEVGADLVVGLTADCPLHDPDVIDEAVQHWLEAHDPFAYAGTARNYPEGLDTDIFSFTALEEAAHKAQLPSEREHLGQYLANRPERFHFIPFTVGKRNDSQMHWSVDSPQDFEFAAKVFETLYPANPHFGKSDILALLEREPELLAINPGGTGYEGLAKSKKKDEEWGRVRKLVLGTVELGTAYGIDGAPQPDKTTSREILDAALAAGIDTFDTAANYGSAEVLLGGWMTARDLRGKVKIISKGLGRADLDASLGRLGLDAIDGYLLHSDRGSFEELKEAKRAGLIGHIGASVYEPEEVRGEYEYVQVPYNALDRRFEDVQGATAFARSPFLQGLLLMSPEQLPPHLASTRPHLEKFIEIANQYNLTQLQVALLFALQGPADYVVFGVKSLPQLKEVLEAAHLDPPEGFVEAVKQIPAPDHAIINPTLWSQTS